MHAESKRQSRTRLRRLFAVFLALCPLQAFSAQPPTVLTPLEASKSVNKLPAHLSFGYSGLAFYRNKLYASCNIGLLEIENSTVSRAFRWNKSDSVVVGPWLDSASGKLWVWCVGDDSFANFDGKTWRTVPMPQLKRGYVTRGDVLSGYRGVFGSNCFWMAGAGTVWPWNEGKKKWGDQLDLPSFMNANRPGTLQRLFFVNDMPFVTARHEPGWAVLGRARNNNLGGDTFHYLDKWWQQIPDSVNKPSFVEQAAAVGHKGFARTIDGDILQIDPSGISELESPGFCESLAATSTGTLLASFRDAGVYEFGNSWALRFKSPYSPSKGKNRVHLAGSDGRIALATSTAGLWFFNGKELVRIAFPMATAKN